MGRRKRSQRKVEPRPAPEPVGEAKEIVQALCPCCGRGIPAERAIKQGYATVGHTDYFESIEWDPQKPFGVAFQAAGRGSLSNWRYLDVTEAPELFEALKGRLLQVVGEWLQKGWISPEELWSVRALAGKMGRGGLDA